MGEIDYSRPTPERAEFLRAEKTKAILNDYHNKTSVALVNEICSVGSASMACEISVSYTSVKSSQEYNYRRTRRRG
jgi:hypothetical protein